MSQKWKLILGKKTLGRFLSEPMKKCEKCFQVTKGSFLTAGSIATYPFTVASSLNDGWLGALCYLAALLSQISSPKVWGTLHFLRKFKNTFSWGLWLSLSIGNILFKKEEKKFKKTSKMIQNYNKCFKITACLSLISILNILQTQPVFHSCIQLQSHFTASYKHRICLHWSLKHCSEYPKSQFVKRKLIWSIFHHVHDQKKQNSASPSCK